MSAGIPQLHGFTGLVMWATYGDGRLFKAKLWSSNNNAKGMSGAAEYSGEFDAHNYNPIYGNSDTVTPKSIKTMLFLKY